MKKKLFTLLLTVTLIGGLLSGCGAKSGGDVNGTTGTDTSGESGSVNSETVGGEVTITAGIPTDYVTDGFEAVADAAKEKLGITIEIQPISNADNTAFKSLLASGETPDIVFYNSGSLLASINPSEYFLDLKGYDVMNYLDKSFKDAVTVGDSIYGIPIGASMGGGVLYNKAMYEKYGLKVPKTWDNFLKNCEALKQAGETAVIGSFGSSWTSQLVFLADYYNITAVEPDFSKNFEAGTAKYADTDIAVNSFEKYADLIPYYNEDSAVATYDDACAMLAEGNGAHYFMQSQALANIYSLYDKESVDNIGFFAVPGDSADVNGMTLWPSNAIYVNKDSEQIQKIIDFFNFYLSAEALDINSKAQLPTGPYSVIGYQPSGESYAAVSGDMQAYFDSGNVALAQEYETAVKGANAESIFVEVATGQVAGKEAAEKYDDDCYKQAIQLGFDWKR